MAIVAQDKLEIHELLTRAYLAIDSEDAAAWAECFAEDGVFVAAYGEWNGRAAVRDFMEEHINKGKEAGVRHFLTNLIVEPDGDGVRILFYILKMNVGSEPAIVATAGGDCGAIKVGGAWLFSRFQLNIDEGSLAKTQTGYEKAG